MNRFANLADRPRRTAELNVETPRSVAEPVVASARPDRAGRKVISGYFSPEMSLSMHMCARRAGITVQELMAEAFDDVLRKHGQSPVGG